MKTEKAKSKRRKQIVDALALMKEIAIETKGSDIVIQVRRNLYDATVHSLHTELAAINGGANVFI